MSPVVVRSSLCVVLTAINIQTVAGQIRFQRPQLSAGQDTNDAGAYVQHARDLLDIPTDSAHAAAEAALIWASRIDPGSGDPPYFLAVAVLRPIMVQARRAGHLSKRLLRRELPPRRVAYVDSLLREAWLREPFYDIDLEALLCPDLVDPHLILDPATRGYFAYQFKNSQLALDSWAEAIAREPQRVDLRLHRAHTFYWMQQYDSAANELRAALATQGADSESSVTLKPRYMLEYALGVAMERAGHVDSAKEAYHRALVDNLGLYMAHVRLSNIVFSQGDTALGLGEIVQAVEVAPREPWLASYFGYQLLKAGRSREAAQQLAIAIALDSAYAASYFLLGMVQSLLRLHTDALASFENFLRRSPVNDERRGWTIQRVSALRTALSGSVGPRD